MIKPTLDALLKRVFDDAARWGIDPMQVLVEVDEATAAALDLEIRKVRDPVARGRWHRSLVVVSRQSAS